MAWSPDGRYLYAAGFYAQMGRNVIVRWPSEEFPSPDLCARHVVGLRCIRALGTADIVYGAVNGDMALIDATGREIYAKSPNLDYFTGKTFSISPDAMTVKFDFLQAGGAPAQFSVESRQLELNPMPNL